MQHTAPAPSIVRFGVFQLDLEAGQLFKNGRVVRLKPQAFKLLQLLVSRAGEIVTREEIRQVLWEADTFVDFDQGVNSAIKQVREALNEDAEHPVFVETVPKRGYRFTAPVEARRATVVPAVRGTDLRLQKALWLNIAELRLADQRRRQRRSRILSITGLLAALAAAVGLLLLLI